MCVGGGGGGNVMFPKEVSYFGEKMFCFRLKGGILWEMMLNCGAKLGSGGENPLLGRKE